LPSSDGFSFVSHALGLGSKYAQVYWERIWEAYTLSMGFVQRNIDAISHIRLIRTGKKFQPSTQEFKHYMDQDIYPEFFTGKLTHNLDSPSSNTIP